MIFLVCILLAFCTAAEGPVSTEPMVFDFKKQDNDMFFSYGNGNVDYGPEGATLNFDKENRDQNTVRVQSRKRYFRGHFSAILKTADCTEQPNAGLNTGYFVFFNNKSDINHNGINDNSEIDFEFLCADPTSIFITVYSDHDNTSVQYKTYRLVNIRTGKVDSYYRIENTTWIKIPTTDTFPAIPDFHPGKKFFEYGFDWFPNGVNFWMRDLDSPDTVLYLWNYTAPPGVWMPPSPTYYIYSTRHTTWTPATNKDANEWPTFDAKSYVKEFRYNPLSPEENIDPCSPTLEATSEKAKTQFNTQAVSKVIEDPSIDPDLKETHKKNNNIAIVVPIVVVILVISIIVFLLVYRKKRLAEATSDAVMQL